MQEILQHVSKSALQKKILIKEYSIVDEIHELRTLFPAINILWVENHQKSKSIQVQLNVEIDSFEKSQLSVMGWWVS